MVIAVLANDDQKKEFLSKQLPAGCEVVWADSIRSLLIIEADIYFDLLFELDADRIAQLKKLLPAPVVVNSVIYTTTEIGAPFLRINAWPTMLARDIVEIAGGALPQQLEWKSQQVPDITGMVTPRSITMIVNEAWFTYGDDISSKEEIDIAMKFGTNYPFGPFEWGAKIGLNNIVALLQQLRKTDERYVIAPALLKETKSNAADFKY